MRAKIVSIPGLPNVNACVEALKGAGFEARPLLEDLPAKIDTLVTGDEPGQSFLLSVQGMTCQ